MRANFVSDELRARFAKESVMAEEKISVGDFSAPIRATPLGLLRAQRDMEFEAGGGQAGFGDSTARFCLGTSGCHECGPRDMET